MPFCSNKCKKKPAVSMHFSGKNLTLIAAHAVLTNFLSKYLFNFTETTKFAPFFN